MKLYKSEFDILRRIIGRKNFTFPDFKVSICDGVLKSSGYCEEKTFVYSLEQKLILPGADAIEFVFPSEEFSKIFQVFIGNGEISIEKADDKLLVSSSDGKKFSVRESIHTTTSPEFEFNDDNFDVMTIEPNDFKQAVSGLGSINAEEVILTTAGGTLDSYCTNNMQSVLKIKSKVENSKTSIKGR